MYILGIDIGGTKCAAVTANWDGSTVTLLEKVKLPTDLTVPPEKMIARLLEQADGILTGKPDSIGISCGGPLDSAAGVVLGPPNLPGWDCVPITAQVSSHYGVEAHLHNDANACAVAEWKFGAGKGLSNVIFMTFGTGLGAGLILDGRLYDGTNGNAGELGHIRLDRFGPVGYGKAGSFEGFCSGGGIAQLGKTMALEQLQQGRAPLYWKEGEAVTALSVAQAARQGDPTAIAVYRTCGEYLGKGLSILMDLLNPQAIVIGSIFARSGDLLWEAADRVIRQEALPATRECCRVLSAALGEHIGDYAAIAAALV